MNGMGGLWLIINVFAGERSVKIELDENMEKATLKSSDGRTYDLQVKEENGLINIYRQEEDQ